MQKDTHAKMQFVKIMAANCMAHAQRRREEKNHFQMVAFLSFFASFERQPIKIDQCKVHWMALRLHQAHPWVIIEVFTHPPSLLHSLNKRWKAVRTWLCTDHYIPASFYWETSALKLQRVRRNAPWQSSSCALWLVRQITPQQWSVKNEQYVCFLNVYIRSGLHRIIFRHQGGEEARNYRHRAHHWFAWDCYKFAHCLRNYHPVEYRLRQVKSKWSWNSASRKITHYWSRWSGFNIKDFLLLCKSSIIFSQFTI